MKRTLFLIIMMLMVVNYIYSQEFAIGVKGKGYEGYVFPKEHSIWGFPPEKDRYTPSFEDIAQAESVLRDSVNTDYVKSNQQAYRKPPINSRTLKKYVRQYVGYLTDNNEIVIWVNLFKKGSIEKQNAALDIISVKDGGYYFWSIRINITTPKLSDMRVNGIS